MKIKFIQKVIDKIRRKGINPNSIEIFSTGGGNEVQIPENQGIKVLIYGNGNKIIIDKSCFFPANIVLGYVDSPVNNAVLKIGRNSKLSGKAYFYIFEDNSTVEIGEDCLFATNININCSDTHTIYDKDSKEILNWGKSVKIGNHVWISRDVTFCKNTEISDNCVIGAGSVVTKSFKEPNCIIAGVPAKVVKQNINWSELRPNQYIKQN